MKVIWIETSSDMLFPPPRGGKANMRRHVMSRTTLPRRPALRSWLYHDAFLILRRFMRWGYMTSRACMGSGWRGVVPSP